MSSVGCFFSYVNDARSHEPEVNKHIILMKQLLMVMVTLAYPRECNLNRLSGAVLTHTFLFVLCRYSAQPVSILQCLPADDCGHCDVHRWGLCHSSLQFAQVRFVWLFTMIRGGADKSLAPPWRKQATATLRTASDFRVHKRYERSCSLKICWFTTRINFRFMWPCIINVGEERTNGWHK